MGHTESPISPADEAAQDAIWLALEAEASARTERRQRVARPKMKMDGAGIRTVILNRRYRLEDAGN